MPLVQAPMKSWAAPSPGFRCQRSSMTPRGQLDDFLVAERVVLRLRLGRQAGLRC